MSQLETLNHRLRGKYWRKALRSCVSTIAMRSCRVIDVDSTEKTAYGKQKGIKKGYNPFRKGKASYHPILTEIEKLGSTRNWKRVISQVG